MRHHETGCDKGEASFLLQPPGAELTGEKLGIIRRGIFTKPEELLEGDFFNVVFKFELEEGAFTEEARVA